MKLLKNATGYYESEFRDRHLKRPGFLINELTHSQTKTVPWHYHTTITDTLYVLSGSLRITCKTQNKSSTSPLVKALS